MSVQEVINTKRKKQHKKNSRFLEVNRHDNNVIPCSKNFSEGNNKITSRNFKTLVTYEQTIKRTMKEIKYNFMEEHKNIINTYCSIYSKQLDDLISDKLHISKNIEKYSNNFGIEINRKILDNLTSTTKIINDIIGQNLDTFLKSLELAHKFYCDIVQSYYNYIIMNINGTEK